MKIAIVGAGAMGSVYAALMADAGNEVWAVDAWAEHIAAIKAGGLRVEGASGDRTVRINATTDPAAPGPCDLVVIATKAMHVEAAGIRARREYSRSIRSSSLETMSLGTSTWSPRLHPSSSLTTIFMTMS